MGDYFTNYIPLTKYGTVNQLDVALKNEVDQFYQIPNYLISPYVIESMFSSRRGNNSLHQLTHEFTHGEKLHPSYIPNMAQYLQTQQCVLKTEAEQTMTKLHSLPPDLCNNNVLQQKRK